MNTTINIEICSGECVPYQQGDIEAWTQSRVGVLSCVFSTSDE